MQRRWPDGDAPNVTHVSADNSPVTPNHWSCGAVRPDGTLTAFFLVHSHRYADRVRLILPEDEAHALVGDEAVVSMTFDGGQPTTICVSPSVAPKLPSVWFAEVVEPDGKPPATNLLAFAGQDIEPGALLDLDALRKVPVKSEDQLGAIRWYPGTGEVDQVYVSPRARRQNLGTALILGAGALNASRACPRFWGDGQRTSDGNRLMSGRPQWSHRVGELTHLAAPMTPFDER